MTGRLSDLARHVVLPEGITSTAWPSVRNTCNQLGITFDGWQDGAGRAILAKRADGLYAADTIGMSIPRQVGKTFLIGAITFALCIKTPGTLVIWTAHRFKTARESFMSLKAMALRKAMQPHVDEDDIYSGSGNESIGFRNGSRILFGARERGFGRGFSEVDVLILDEAQILSETAMEDMVPTTNAAPNPLIFLTGTPPRPRDPGEVFTSLRRAALDGTSEDVLYIEFSADPDARPSDRAQWSKANPSHPQRTSARAILRMMKNLPPDSFMREGLGVWDDSSGNKIFGSGKWEACAGIPPAGLKMGALAIAVTEDLAHAAIVAAGMASVDDDDGMPVERVVVKPLQHGPGWDWVLSRGTALFEQHKIPLLIAKNGPAAPLIPFFVAEGVEVQIISSSEELDAFAVVYRLVQDARLLHGRYQELELSLNGAMTRMVGDRRVLARKQSNSDMSVVEAMTLAAWRVAGPVEVPPPAAPAPRLASVGRSVHPVATAGF